MRRRLVLVHPNGLHQILFAFEEGEEPPVAIANLPRIGAHPLPFVSMFKADSRAVYYKEPLVPQSYTFNPAQQ